MRESVVEEETRSEDFLLLIPPSASDSYISGWEEGGDDARSACPFDVLGYTHNTMGVTTGRDAARLS